MGLPPVQTQITSLAARVAVLDGQGLTSPLNGFTSQTTSKFAGLSNDIQQAVLSLEATINSVAAQMQNIQASLNALLGIAGLSPVSTTMTPPSS
jgi:hypothetical protein